MEVGARYCGLVSVHTVQGFVKPWLQLQGGLQMMTSLGPKPVCCLELAAYGVSRNLSLLCEIGVVDCF